MVNNNHFAVIMAGGVGSRFWPVSTQEHPKQFHDMLGTGKSLLRHTFERLSRVIPPQNILISTNDRYRTLVLETLPEVSENQLVLEPAMRNTAPAVLYAALKIQQQNPEAVMIIAPSDHWIEKEDVFIDTLNQAFKHASQHDVLMTLGIQPTYPNTGYGYIQYDNTAGAVKKVVRFTEKPDIDTAQRFLAQGNYLWNAGIFIWSAQSILKAFKMYQPSMLKVFNHDNNVYNTALEAGFIQDNYPKAESISIDYAILEPSENVEVIPVEMGWNDLGTWGSLYEKLPKDTNKNAVIGGQTIIENAGGNMIRTSNQKKVFIQGLQDFIIIDEGDFLVILPKENEQDIKSISQKLTS